MIQIVLIGLGAGAAAGLLSASIVSGSIFAIILFYLAPLPILIAALGWSHWAALIAAVSAAAGLAAVLGVFSFVAFLVGVGVPAWWLGYLALLARPVGGNGAAPVLEWYPVGRLVFWAALIGFVIVGVAMASYGTDVDSFQAGLRSEFERVFRSQPPKTPRAPSSAELSRVIDIMIAIIPPLAAVTFTFVNVVNLWLAGRIVSLSGRLKRPWPDLSALALPQTAGLALLAGVAGVFLSLPGFAGKLGIVLAVSMLMAFALQGFAVLHSVTKNLNSRTFVLTAAYIAVILAWPALLLASLLGVADSIFNIRAWSANRRGPPTLRT
jgi:hypothetical protein